MEEPRESQSDHEETSPSEPVWPEARDRWAPGGVADAPEASGGVNGAGAGAPGGDSGAGTPGSPEPAAPPGQAPWFPSQTPPAAGAPGHQYPPASPPPGTGTWGPSAPDAQGGSWGAAWPPPPATNYPGWGGGQEWSNEPGPNPYGGPPAGPGHWSGGWEGGGPGWSGGPGGQGGWDSAWTPGEPPRPRRTLPGAITALLLAVAVLVGLGLGHSVWRDGNAIGNSPSGSGSGPITGVNPFGGNGSSGSNGSGSSASGGPSNASAIAAKASPDLVDINTDLTYQGGEAAGTGIVLSSDGMILTNNHVISGATRIRVTDVGNGQTYTGVVMGYDRSHDIAVIKLQSASNLSTANIGDSSRVSVGDQIVGLGNAGGVGGTPSSAGGTVTALDQSITATDEGDGTSEQLTGLIQVDANIQPGDSGGALVDGNGRVIGVDTAASEGFSFQGAGDQGYAIPINQALTVVHQIESGQSSSIVHIGPTAFLGVLVSGTNSGSTGATLARAVPGGPAAEAGLTSGDTITSLAGHTVDKPSTLTNLILLYHPGDKVQVGWSDSAGQTHQTTVTLTTGPAQ